MHGPDEREELTPAQRELEGSLRGLRPAPTSISRDRLLFEAGAAAGRRSVNVWRGAAAVLVAALGLALVARPGEPQQVVREIVYVDRVVEQPATDQAVARTPLAPVPARRARDTLLFPPGGAQPNYLLLRDRVLQWGVAAALPLTPNTVQPAQPLRLEELLDPHADQPAASRPAAPIRNLRFFGDRL